MVYDSTPTGEERMVARQFLRSLVRQRRGITDPALRAVLVRSDALTDLQTLVAELGGGCDPQQARQIARAKALVAELDEWNRRP